MPLHCQIMCTYELAKKKRLNFDFILFSNLYFAEKTKRGIEKENGVIVKIRNGRESEGANHYYSIITIDANYYQLIFV